MNAPLRARTALCLPLVGLLLAVLVPPTVATAAMPATAPALARAKATPTASLRISPGAYVGGQSLLFEGNIGKKGKKRNIHLQTHMARPGDRWTDLPGSGAKTDKKGRFRFRHPAPSMFGIRMRVVSGKARTPGVTLSAKSQDLALKVVGGGAGIVDPGQVLAGEAFTIKVDTTPTTPKSRPDLPPPAFPGRPLSLQERVNGHAWQTVDTTTTDSSGNATFPRPPLGLLEGTDYRVVQAALTAGPNDIGWFPSFPLMLEGVAARSVRTGADTPLPGGSRASRSTPQPARTGSGAAGPTAASRYKWGPFLFDFAWEFGESLSSRPYRGTDRVGSWRDNSDGSGRVAKHNGGLSLDSQRSPQGAGDRGSIWATMRGNPMPYGRWETKLRMKSAEAGARDYRVRIELVPEQRAGDFSCRAQTITVADFAPHSSTVAFSAFGAGAGDKWAASASIGSLIERSAAFAVEVSKGRISWFVSGRPFATLKDADAVPDVPMTMRMSMVGQYDGAGEPLEMNRTQLISDWQRGYSLSRSDLNTAGPAAKPAPWSGC